MKLSLVVLAAGKQEGKVIEIKIPQFVIGRDPTCQLRPNSPMISKKHCALIQKDGKVYIKDFGSTNGSFVNDQQVQNAAVQLGDGDTLKIGPLLFSVRLEAGAAASTPTPVPQQAAAQPAAKPGQPAAAKPGQPAAAKPGQPAAAKPGQPAAAKPGQPAKVGAAAASGVPTPPSDSQSESDDDIAAMLLAVSEDETVSDGPAAIDIPQGTTIFEMPIPNPDGGEPAKAGDSKDKPPEPPKEKQSNSAVAASILEKLRKRPRST
jgi:predicted component of type VI protein secretion system